MSKHIDFIVSSWGFTGWQFDIIASLIFVVISMTMVVVIGSFVNYLEQLQMRGLSKFIGDRGAEFICNRLLFPGTVVHELSHAFFATISGAKVTKIRCFTLFSKDTLGYVEFGTRGGALKRSFQLSFTSCAPTVMGCVWIFVILKVLRMPDLNFASQAGLVYLLISIADHMSMSSVDVKNYIKGGILLFFVFFVFCVGFHHFL